MRFTRLSLLLFFLVTAAAAASIFEYRSGIPWQRPKVIDPGPPGGPPSDAVVLFDGKDLSQWEGGEKWLVRDGVATAEKGSIRTKQSFGDCQLHLEWAAPEEVEGVGQARGNSGVFLMDIYEVQILDSWQNPTYPDGQCGAIYKQRPPLVNASRRPGQWQAFDIVFHGPRFDAEGKLLRPATITLLHNGVLVQDHFELLGDTSYVRPPLYRPHPAKLPLRLQYHRDAVRFRNIWLRELPEFHVPAKPSARAKPEIKPCVVAKPEKPKTKGRTARCKTEP